MNREELIITLDNLYETMRTFSSDISSNYKLYCMSKEDREEYYREAYIKDNELVEVVDYSRIVVEKDYDLGIMDKLVGSMNQYIEMQENKLNNTIIRYQNAVKVFKAIVDLPTPMSDVLYLTYFKKMNANEISKCIFISRASYFRIKRTAIALLLSNISFE